MPVTSMPQSACPAQDASSEEVVLGVDTHRDIHVAAVVTMVGTLTATSSFPATAAGYRRLLAWARSAGAVQRAGVECTGSYGAALSRYLQAEGISVIDVNQPDRATRRKRGKTDAVDAESAARAVMSGRADSIAKTGDGLVEAMRVLKLARDSAVNARTKAINQLRAILVGADPALRESLAGLGPGSLIRACARLDDPGGRQRGPAHRHLHPAAAGQPDPGAQSRVLRAAQADQRPGRSPAPPSCCNGRESDPTAPRRCSSQLATTRNGCGARAPTQRFAASAQSKHPPETPSAAGSTAAAIGKPTPRSTGSPCPDSAGTSAPSTTCNAACATARPAGKPSAALSATSPARSIALLPAQHPPPVT